MKQNIYFVCFIQCACVLFEKGERKSGRKELRSLAFDPPFPTAGLRYSAHPLTLSSFHGAKGFLAGKCKWAQRFNEKKKKLSCCATFSRISVRLLLTILILLHWCSKRLAFFVCFFSLALNHCPTRSSALSEKGKGHILARRDNTVTLMICVPCWWVAVLYLCEMYVYLTPKPLFFFISQIKRAGTN